MPPSVSDSSRKLPYTNEPPVMPPAFDKNSYRQPQLGNPIAAPPTNPAPAQPARVRLDKIVSLPCPNVEGQVLGTNRLAQSAQRAIRQRRSGERARGSHDRHGRPVPRRAECRSVARLHAGRGRPPRVPRKLEVHGDDSSPLTLETP